MSPNVNAESHDLDLYGILGVQCQATQDDIKRAYRKLALTHHPDKQKVGGTSDNSFQSISLAYSILKDPTKREYYDKNGTIDDIDADPAEFMQEFQVVMEELLGEFSMEVKKLIVKHMKNRMMCSCMLQKMRT